MLVPVSVDFFSRLDGLSILGAVSTSQLDGARNSRVPKFSTLTIGRSIHLLFLISTNTGGTLGT